MLKMASTFTTCLFCSCFFLDRWNLVSMQRGTYRKPSLRITSGRVTVRGGILTMRCTGPYPDMTFALYRGTDPILKEQDPSGTEAVFHFSDVNPGDAGSYRCFYYSKGDDPILSDPSDSVEVTLRDLPKPSISYEMVRNLEGDYKINCSAPQDKTVKSFFLYEDGAQTRLADRTPSPGRQSVTFPISGMNTRVVTEYRCSYQIQESGEIVESPLSDPVQIGKGDDQLPSQFTTPSNEVLTPSAEPDTSSMMTTTYIAIGCAVLLVVILVVALILYIKCKPKKAKGDIQKRNLPLNEQKNAEALETTYATVTKVKASNHTIAPEVKRQKEDRDDEGLTYATINKDALKTKKKNSSSPFQEPETTLYAAVNIH